MVSARRHKNSLARTRGDSTMECPINNSTDSTMITNTEIASDNSNFDSGMSDSVLSCNVSSISNEVLSCYSNNTDEEGVSLVPKWKDDGDDSICTTTDNHSDDNEIENDTESYKFHRIPSTLEFILLEGKTDGVGDGEQQPVVSPSSLSYSHHSRRLLQIDFREKELPSLPVVSLPSGPRSEKKHSNRGAVVKQVATDIANTERRSSFRRRLHSGTDIGSTGTTPMSESQSSSQYLPASAPSRSTAFSRSRPRFALMFGAMILVMLSVHDNIKKSRLYYRQQYQLSLDINNRREEIAFPLVQVEVHSDAAGTTDGVTLIDQENHSVRNHYQPKAELPKYYFPKFDPLNTKRVRGSTTAGHPGSNLVMGRPQQPRPIFVPDSPLPDGGFRKPLERFVFDSQKREQKEEQLRDQRYVLENDDSSSSWTSWIASMTVIGMLFDTGWKEYQRCRIAAIPSSRDE